MKRASNKTAFREVPYMGVIWVVAEAAKLGFYNGNPEWSNLGQGQPEVGEMDGAPPRITHFDIEPGDQAYGPLGGSAALRERIAEHYNRLYRTGHSSRYTPENVSVVMGGRLALTRLFACFGKIRLGYRNPDYTAYKDMILYRKENVTPVEIPVREDELFIIPAPDFDKIVTRNRLHAFLMSNPCNPTGVVLKGSELDEYVRTASRRNCALVMDEFYSHFIYEDQQPGDGPVSAAAYVKDVNKDPVILVDGLTKSFRYPGWRLGWILGPKKIIENIDRAASAVDGGPSQVVTRAALKALDSDYADRETSALRKVFSRKKNIMSAALSEAGVRILPSDGTFYLWGNISGLPRPINNAKRFFTEALKHKVMTVPGYFFDIRAGKKRKGAQPFDQWVRFSFGPPEQNMVSGLERLTGMIASFRKGK